MSVSFYVRMLYILLLCPVMLASSVLTLTIDSQLGTSVEDCFERISIGERLPRNEIYRNVSELTTVECEQICKQDKKCQAYDYGVGAKGNATCDLSNLDEKEIKEKNLFQRNPDYDVYVRRILCEQSPPLPIEKPFDGDGPEHKPIVRPEEEAKRPLSDDLNPYESSRPQPSYMTNRPYPGPNERPDDYNSVRPENDRPPSYGDHKPQDIPFRPERPYKNSSRPDPYDQLYFQEPNKRPRPGLWRPDPYHPPQPGDELQDIYGPKPNRPKPDYISERPLYQYIIRPNRKPYKPEDGYNQQKPNYPSYDSRPDRPYKPTKPYDKPSYTTDQYASNYGTSQDNSIYLEIHDPPRPYRPNVDERPYYGSSGQSYGQNYGYNSFSAQNSYSQSQAQYGMASWGHGYNDHRPEKPYPNNDTGYGNKPYNPKPSYSQASYNQFSQNLNQASYGESYNQYTSHGQNQGNRYGNQAGGSYGQNQFDPQTSYGNQASNSHGKPSNQYGGQQTSNQYGQNDSSQSSGYGSQNNQYSGVQTGYGTHISDYGGNKYGSQSQNDNYGSQNGYGNQISSNNNKYGSQSQYDNYGSQNGYGNQMSINNNKYGPQSDYDNRVTTSSSQNQYGSSQSGYGNQQSSTSTQNSDKYNSDSGYGNRPSSASPQSGYGSSQSNYGNQASISQSGYGSSQSDNQATGNLQSGYGSQISTTSSQNKYGNQESDPQSSYGSSQSGYGSSQGASGSSQSVYGNSQSGYGNSQSGYGSSQSDRDSSHNGYGSSQSGYGSSQNGYGSSQSDRDSSQNNFANSQSGNRNQASNSYGSQSSQHQQGSTSGGNSYSTFDNQNYYGSHLGYGIHHLYGIKPGSYGKEPNHDFPPIITDKDPYIGYKKPNQESNGYANQDDFAKPDMKPVYESNVDKSNVYNDNLVTSKPVAVSNNGYGKNPGGNISYKACFKRVLAGKRALRSYVRRVVDCEQLEDCRRECATERRFHCESFNYKLDPTFRGKGLCELMTKPIEAFDIRQDFVEDKDYDFYELDRNSLEPYCPETLRGPGLLHSGYLSSKPKENWRDRVDYAETGYKTINRFYDERRTETHNRRYEDQFYIPYQIGASRTSDDQEKWGEYGGMYGGVHSYYKDKNDYHKSANHWKINDQKPYTGVKHYNDVNDFDYYSLRSNSDYENHGYGFGAWKKGQWNGSGSFWKDFERENYNHKQGTFEVERRNDDSTKDCSSRRSPGMSLGSGAIRRSLYARTVVECEAACFSEREFKCVSYSYRYSGPPASDNCFLSERPYTGLQMSTDSGSDVYAMPLHHDCLTVSTKPWVESECFWHVRSGSAVTGAGVRAALTVTGLGACEAECIRAHSFFCRGFSFRFDPPTIGDDLENCLLTSSPPTSLELNRGLRPSKHELYSRGNYGRGCEPALYDDVNKEPQCYLQYASSAKLSPSAVRGRAQARDERACGDACTDAPFKCLSFSYSNNAGLDTENCLLSEIRLFDLQRGVDYEHSDDDLLFAFDLFNGQCWRKVRGKEEYDVPTLELPRPLHASSIEETYPGPISGPDLSPHSETYIPSSGPTGYGPGPGPGPGQIKPYIPETGPDYKPGYEPSGPVIKPAYEPDTDLKPAYIPESGPESGPTGPSGPPNYKPFSRPHYIEPYKPSYSRPYKPEYSSHNDDFRPSYKPESYGPSYKPESYGPIYKPESYGSSYKPEGYGPSYKPEGYGPSYDPGYKPDIYRPGYKPDSSGPIQADNRPNYRPSGPYLPGPSGPSSGPRPYDQIPSGPESNVGFRPGRPSSSSGDRVDESLTLSWRHYTVSGFPCRKGSSCEQNLVAGHWACEPEGGEVGSWDYCCAPTHRCGYSEGFTKPWCFVGPSSEQWRPCSEKYYPYHQHKGPHPSQGQAIREAVRPRPDRPIDKPPTDNHETYLSEADRKYWDDLYKDGPQAYYDKHGNPLPGYTRVPTEDRPHIKYQRNPPKPGSGLWVSVNEDEPPAGLGAPRYWPVAYLHKGPPPNMTYFRFNETEYSTQNQNQSSKRVNLDKTTKNDIASRSNDAPRAEKRINITNDYDDLTIGTTTTNKPDINYTTETTTDKEIKMNNTEFTTSIKPEYANLENNDFIKGIDGKLHDFTHSLEIFDIDDVKCEKELNRKNLEAEEKQIEAIGRLIASKRGGKLILEKRSQKDLESKSIALDKDLIDFNFGNRFPTSERRGVIQKVTKDDIKKDFLNDKSLEVSETTFVRNRVLTTTENIKKALVNGKVFYDATLRDQNIFNNTRRSKNLRLEENRAPVPNGSTKKKNVRTRNTNPVRRVRRVYRKRYNPEEVRKRLLEREKNKEIKS